MKTSVSIISLLLLLSNLVQAVEVTISERPEWQLPILKHVIFDAQAKGIDEILDRKASTSGDYWIGFVVFTCTAKENLEKRILWIDAEITFSNGYKREFKGVSFHLLQEGAEYNIEKIPFESREPVAVKSVFIKSIAMK